LCLILNKIYPEASTPIQKIEIDPYDRIEKRVFLKIETTGKLPKRNDADDFRGGPGCLDRLAA
jgi:hypothetical protein